MAKNNNTTAKRRTAAAARRAGGANGAKVAGNRSFGTFANNKNTAAGRVTNARRAGRKIGGGGIGAQTNKVSTALRAARRAGGKAGGGRNG